MAVGWISSDRVAALLQSGGLVIIDARTGQVERRWPLSYRVPCDQRRQARTPYGVVFLLVGPAGAARLVRVDADGLIRVINLPRIRAPSDGFSCGAVAFAVDPEAERAILLTGRGPIAEVALKSMTVTYRARPRALSLSPACRRARGACTSGRTAIWSSGDTVAVSGTDSIDRPGVRPIQSPAGAVALDTRTWSARSIDRTATGVAFIGSDTILAFGGARSGLSATTVGGQRVWSALKGRQARKVAVAGNRIYVLDNPPRTTRVLDTKNGTLIFSQPRPRGRLDVLTGRTEAGPS